MNRALLTIPAFLILLLSLVLFSCSKDKYTTKPQLKLTSINTVVPVNGQLEAKFEYTSKPGDIGGGTMLAIRNRLNQDSVLVGAGNTDTLPSQFPSFPTTPKAEIEYDIDWQSLHEDSNNLNDTIIMKYALIDAAGNSSDTISSPQIVILHE
jgi:hypothetical protein